MTISNLLLLTWLVFSPMLPSHASTPIPHTVANTAVSTPAAPRATPPAKRLVARCSPMRIDCPASISYTEFRRIFVGHHTLMSEDEIRYAYNVAGWSGIDAGWEAAILCKESTCAARGNVTRYCHNGFNVVATKGAPACPYNAKYRYYDSLEEATTDWCRRVKLYYVDEGIVYIGMVIAKYAPYSDGNNPKEYTRQVTSWLAYWRREDPDKP